MALRDWLTGKDHYKEVPATSPSVATVAEEEHHILQPLSQEISGIEATVATVATVAADNEERTKECNNHDSSLEQYTLSFRISCTPATLATLATLQCSWGLVEEISKSAFATLATLPCLQTNCPCSETQRPLCLFFVVAIWTTVCRPAQTLTIPDDQIEQIGHLQTLANERIRLRHPSLRIWREGENQICCKAFLGLEPPPYRRVSSKKY